MKLFIICLFDWQFLIMEYSNLCTNETNYWWDFLVCFSNVILQKLWNGISPSTLYCVPNLLPPSSFSFFYLLIFLFFLFLFLSLSPSFPHFLDVCGSCPISGHLLVCEVRKEEACDSFIYIKLSVESSWKSWTTVFVFKIFHFGHKVHFFLALIICLSLTLSVFLITKKRNVL